MSYVNSHNDASCIKSHNSVPKKGTRLKENRYSFKKNCTRLKPHDAEQYPGNSRTPRARYQSIIKYINIYIERENERGERGELVGGRERSYKRERERELERDPGER